MEQKLPDLHALSVRMGAEKARFEAFCKLLTSYDRCNLTAITDPREIGYKHFLDSAAGDFLFPEGAHCLEVGSGAGFPSIPLMLLREDLCFTLVESTGKKCAFLETAKRELGLSCEIVCARAEELATDPAYREKYDISCARAVARLDTLAEYCIPFVKCGGAFIAYKGADDETACAGKAFSVLGCGAAEVYRFSLPEGYGQRSLIFAKKLHRSPAKYPRGGGAERRRPIA